MTMEPSDTVPRDTGDDSAAVSNGAPPIAASTAAVKTATRKRTSVKRGAAKRKGLRAKSSAQVAQQAKFPRHSVERALRIPKAIYDQNGGNPCTVKEAATFTGAASASGNFNVEVSSAKKYGYLASEGGKLVLQERARKAIAPQSDTDRVTALRDALLAAPELSDVYNLLSRREPPRRAVLHKRPN
jgi:hypothetical protein